jgi:chromate reductase
MLLPRFLFINGGLGGETGNTAALLQKLRTVFESRARISEITLSTEIGFTEVSPLLAEADGVVIGTGTHWDSWSHRLQKFLEDATPSEATALWLGKPAGVVISMHSVGGKGVLSRLQGVLSTFGCVIPPMSGIVCSWVNQSAIAAAGPGVDDLWSADDLAVVAHNLLVPFTPGAGYKAWPVDRADYARRWVQT